MLGTGPDRPRQTLGHSTAQSHPDTQSPCSSPKRKSPLLSQVLTEAFGVETQCFVLLKAGVSVLESELSSKERLLFLGSRFCSEHLQGSQQPIHNCHSRDSSALCWPPQAPDTHGHAHTYIHTYICRQNIHTQKINIFLKAGYGGSAFNPNAWEVEAGRALNSSPAWSA